MNYDRSHSEMQDPFLIGEHVYLRALRSADADGAYPSWFNDSDSCAGNSHHVFPYTRQSASDYIEAVGRSRDSLVLAIVLRESGQHVGNIALQSIHPINRCADFSIMIGESAARAKGIGEAAGKLLLAHGFDALNMHRIGCGTFANNSAMVKLALALGMKEEGRRREAAYKDGRYLDVVEFGILRTEFSRAI